MHLGMVEPSMPSTSSDGYTPAQPISIASLATRRGLRANLAPVECSTVRGEGIRRLLESESLQDLYSIEEELHHVEANQCKVIAGRCQETGSPVVIKMRGKRFAPGGEHVWRSVLERMLNLEAHTHVLGLRMVCEDAGHYYIIMERCSGGELFDFLSTETDVPERECKRIMREILEAVTHIHEQGLIHRDIKPENIMFHDTRTDPVSPGHKNTVKLIDFDTCQEYEPSSPKAKHVVGTMGYIAPEALKGDYSPASDLWSVGVILYILMTGDMPFDMDSVIEETREADTQVGSSNMEQLYEALSHVAIDFDCEPWPMFPKARDLCQMLLAFDPGDRSPSARDALNHPWLTA